jgi:deaminated glutathione amidase
MTAGNLELLRVAAVQLGSQDDVGENLARAAAEVRAAASRGARLIVLPENFAYLGPEPGKRQHAERLGDLDAPIQAAVAAMARETGATVVAGGFPETSGDPDRPFNTCAAFAPDGGVIGAYRKIHLFDVELPDGTALSESVATSAGSEPVVVEVEGHRIGLSVCYDLRFPELYRALVDRGAEVLLVPAAFTLQTGKDHWHVLLRARAIESQSWVIAAAQWGRHPKDRASYGHALIADPWGTVVADCSDGIGVAVADVDRRYTQRVRTILPSLAHRRL